MADSELSRLRLENQTLAEELAQCQADKEFVWSLWKRLQVANPDITQAVGMVVQREKEKAELKDRKVLEILQIKDVKIAELQATVSSQSDEIAQMLQRKVEIQSDMGQIEHVNKDLTGQITKLEEQLRTRDNREKGWEELHRQKVERLEEEKRELENKITKLVTEVNITKGEKADVIAVKVTHENKVKKLEQEIKDMSENHDKLSSEFEESRKLLRKTEDRLKKQNQEISAKNTELENVRKELSDLWSTHNQCNEHAAHQAELIRQLQALQLDTQKMLKNQEDAYTMEAGSLQSLYSEMNTKYSNMKEVETQLRQEILDFKERILAKEDTIKKLEADLEEATAPTSRSFAMQASMDEKECQAVENDVDTECRIHSLETEVDLLKEKIKVKNRIINQLEKEGGRDELEDLTLSPIHLKTSSPVRGRPVKKTPGRSISVSPSKKTTVPDLQRRLDINERKLEDCQRRLELKTKELTTTKIAHSRRLERLKALQNSYRLVKDQLKTFEDEQHKPKKKKIPRAGVKDLQRENSDAVWNELAYYKKENKNLLLERMNLQEELDCLSVQTSQDAATIYELRACLQKERDELEYVIEERDRDKLQASTIQGYKEQLREAKVQISSNEDLMSKLTVQIDKLEEQKAKLEEECEGWMEERRSLKSEITSLKQAAADRRIEISDLRTELHRLQIALRKQEASPKKKKKVSIRSKKSPVAKGYQKLLNKSIEKMTKVFQDFDDNGWDEVSTDSNEDYDGNTSESSLGTAIVKSAKGPSGSDTDNTARKTGRKNKRGKIPQLSNGDGIESLTSETMTPRVDTQDIGTSPLKPKYRVISRKGTGLSVTGANNGKQIATLKTRISGMTKQIQLLRTAKGVALKSVSDLRDMNEQLKTDLNTANQKLKIMRQNVQKLTTDVEQLQKENKDLHQQCEDLTPDTADLEKKMDQEWKHMENRLKASAAEVTRQSTIIKTMKTEKEELEQQIRTIQEKMNRMERDNTQKRTLVEDLKLKLKIAQENMKTDSGALDELEIKLKNAQDALERTKIYNESLRRRLAAVTKEKHESEDSFLKSKSDLEKKTKQLSECQTKLSQLESTIAEVEQAAKQQLHGLANQSEVAMEAAQVKLTKSHALLQEYERFVKSLAHEILQGVQQTRALMKQKLKSEEMVKQEDQSLKKAKKVAKTILNISQSELEDLMMSDEGKNQMELVTEIEKRKDKKWHKKLVKLLQTKTNFALPLIDLFSEKIDERIQLMGKLHAA